MVTTRRRSARLASGVGGSSIPKRSLASYVGSKLSSLLERDETPKAQRSSNALISSAPANKTHKVPGAFENEESYVKTPEHVPELIPEEGEMHPKAVHQSTTKGPDSALCLGFADLKESLKPSAKAVENTPSKSSLPANSAGFDFKWNRPESDLSSEAQRIMESVREEAAKIKEKLQLEREEQAYKGEEADQCTGVSGRKFATPRRKTGRFSDAHKAEFQKMDSIANHPSAWKAKLQPSQSQTALKRTKSRADLGADVAAANETEDSSHAHGGSPGKRVRMRVGDDVTTGRPTSKDGPTDHTTRLQKALPSAATTPTKSSLARAASVKNLRTTRIPGLSHSKSAVKLSSASPVAPRTEGSNKYFSALARAGSMKSILHKPQPKFSDDPVKIAAGTHLPTPKRDANTNKTLPNLPGGSLYPQLNRTPTLKRVGFHFAPKDSEVTSPPDVGTPSPVGVLASPSTRLHFPHQLPTTDKDQQVKYPDLKITGKKQGPLSSHPPGPGDFTFRATTASAVIFGPGTSGLGLATTTSPTIRHVRPSGIVTPVPAPVVAAPLASLPAVPHGMPNKKRRRVDDDDDDDDMDMKIDMDDINGPRGIENRAPPLHGQSPAKKLKTTAASNNLSREQQQALKKQDTASIGATARRRLGVAASKVKSGFASTGTAATGAKNGGAAKKPGLSLSRLNMLARPKNRG